MPINKKLAVLDALVTAIQALALVNKCTRDLLTPAEQRSNANYVGVSAGDEQNVAEDSTDIRFTMEVDLILVVLGNGIEELIDQIKTEIYAPISIGALYTHLEGAEHITLVDADAYSSARMNLQITYVVSKADF